MKLSYHHSKALLASVQFSIYLFISNCFPNDHSLFTFQGLSLDVLKQYGCRSSSDGSRLIVPVYRPMIDQSMVNISGSRNNLLQPVGYFSIPLLQKSPQVLHQLNKDQILARLLTHQQLRLSNSLLTYDNIKEKVYHRIKHPCEVRGVPWARFPELNRVLLGHRSGEVTVVSGPTGAGKTTFLAEYSLDLAVQGVVTLWASLEVSVERLAEVLLQQYSGAPLPTDRTSFDALSYLFKQVPLHFLDVHGQQELEVIMQALRESVMVRGVRHVVVDNLQFLVGCQRSFSERWQHQDLAMAAFRSFATQFGCHVTLIVHPRKLQADELLTMQSIGGGARVTQEADNVMLLQVQGSNPVSCRKAIEVVKNRFGGHLGVVPIKFHQESLTFSGFFRKSKDSQKNKEGKQRPPESREL
ncbi:hypothetical protein HAZT_HAZT002030 [Hyalella azteca]|uniref:SF4 helicase domain-containing protein n=1 Tax=Hyalella azteca TaxID=294128 RepID=A0A6A0H982_HYAAZ|nr:hypothetical protein HAZT_HAZT002030 [Hyalella azteca]